MTSAEVHRHGEHSYLLLMIGTSVPSFMLQLDANIVSVSLPAIAQSLHAGFADIEWVVSAYVLTFASCLLPAGAFADRYGRKKLLVLGLSVFTLSSLACGLAQSLPQLIAARAAQGAGAALQLSAALATLSSVIPAQARARAFAFWGSTVGAGMACGPLVGGLITQTLGWSWAFYINIPIGLLLLVFIVRVLPDTRDPQASRLDVFGVFSFAGALFLATLCLISGNRDGWSSPLIGIEAAGSLVLFAAFIVGENWQRRPMLELDYFRRPTFLGAVIAQLVFSISVLTLLTYLPIFLQSALGFPSATAGLLMLPMVVPVFVVPRIVSGYLVYVGPVARSSPPDCCWRAWEHWH